MIPRAKQLRKDATKQEKHLWYDYLRTYPVRFQRQKTIRGFIVDFYCHAARLVIELDGAQHNKAQGMAYDRERTAVLESYHLFVIRFSNQQIDKNFSEVCTQIDQIVKQRTKSLPL
ncbi:MAG: endonuclease domain-containing protein [Eubacteriales bacterium]|nr:endonuclease domain-containing protein [Eubacteriales bacterium]